MSFKTSSKILDAVTLDSSLVSQALALDFVSGFSVHAVFTGSPSGEFKLQVSNDDAAVPTNWTDLADSAQAIIAAGDIMWSVSEARYKWVRVVYTFLASTGVCTATAITKDITHG